MLQAPFKSEAPLLLEVFHLLFGGISAAELLVAEAPGRSGPGSRSLQPSVRSPPTQLIETHA